MRIIILLGLGLVLLAAPVHAAGDYRGKARQAMEYVTNPSNNMIDPSTGLLWSTNFIGDLPNSGPCWSGSYFYHTARAVMGEHATGVGIDLADRAVSRVFVENYREDGSWSYPHEPWFGRMSYPNNDGQPWPNNSIYEDSQAWLSLGNVIVVMNSLASTGAYSGYVERLIDGIINQDVPVKGGYAYNSTTGAMQYYNGSAWVPATRYTAIFVGIMRKVNPAKYASEISRGTTYLNDNTMGYIGDYSSYKAFLTPYFMSAYALLGNGSMVDRLFTTFLGEYGDGVNFTHSFQQLHAGNLSINSNIYHAIGINALVGAYNVTGNETYLMWARQIADHMLAEHWNSTGNYFTNLNEMNTSRSSYCNYQKALAEVNGVAAASFVRLAAEDKAPPVVTPYFPVNNTHLSSTNVTFNFSALDNFVDLMNYTLYIDGVPVQTGYITNNTPNTVSVSVSIGFHNWSLAVSDDAGNTGSSGVLSFSAGGYVVTDLPSGRRAVLVENESVDVTLVPQLGVKEVYLARGVFGSKGKIIAKLTLNFTGNISLGGISLHTNRGQRKAVVHRSSWPPGVKTKTLLIPKVFDTGSVYICPDATTLSEVHPECTGVFTVNVGQTVGNVTLNTAVIEEEEYYLASGITGTGGGETDDTVPPNITVFSPYNASISDDTPLLNVTFGEVVSYAWYSIDGTGNSTPIGSVSNLTLNLSALSEGAHTVTVFANDTAGNLNLTSVYFTVDTMAPLLRVLHPGNKSYYSVTWFNASVYDAVSPVGLNVALQLDGLYNYTLQNTSGNWNYQASGLSEGVHEALFFANDTAGNLNLTSVYFTVDRTPPGVTILSPGNTSYYYGMSINITYGAGEATADPSYSLDGGDRVSFINGSTVIAPGIGAHNMTVWAMDSAGNWGNATVFFTVVGVVEKKVNLSSMLPRTTNSSGLITTSLGNYSWVVTTNDTTVPVEIVVNVSMDAPPGAANISEVSGAIPGLYFHITVNDSSWYSGIESILVKLYYAEADIPSGVEESTLRPLRYTSGEWVRLAAPPQTTLADGTVLYASGVNTSDNYVWANLSRFSVYGLGGSVAVQPAAVPFEEDEGDAELPLVVRSGFIKVIPEVVPDLILDFNYMTKQFYVTEPQLYGVLGALDSYPISRGLRGEIDFYAASPTRTLEVLPGVIIAELRELYARGEGDAYAVAAERVMAKYKRADRVIIARGDLGVDSLAAVSYARHLNAPVLLVTPESVPSVTRTVLEALGVASTIVIGGREAVSGDVEAELPSPFRIGGRDRYETAVKVAEMLMAEKKADTVVVTDGLSPEPSVVMLASFFEAPIVYTAGDKVPKETADFLRKHRFKKIFTAGLSDAAEAAVKSRI